MAGTLEEAKEYEAGGDGGVQHAEEDEGGDHEGKRHFLVELVAEGAKGRRGVVLGAGVDVDDGADEAEDDDLGDGDGPQGFGEVGRVAHLGDEAGERDLPDEWVGDVEEGAEPVDEGGAGGGDDVDDGRAALTGGVGDVGGGVWAGLDAGEDGGEEDGNEGEEGGESCELGERVEGSGERAHEGDDGKDGGKSNGAHAMVGHSIEIFSTD